jgi:hypothetical protein
MIVNNDARTTLDRATDAVRGAAETVQSTTESIAAAIEDSRQPRSVLDRVSRVARDAPLRSLALAFMVGWLVARRR